MKRLSKEEKTLLRQAVDLASFRWSDMKNGEPGTTVLLGHPKGQSTGMAKSRRLKRIVNRLAERELFSTKTLSANELDYLWKVSTSGPKLFCDDPHEMEPKGRMFSRMKRLGLVKVTRKRCWSGSSYFDRLVRMTDKGKNALNGDGCYE